MNSHVFGKRDNFGNLVYKPSTSKLGEIAALFTIIAGVLLVGGIS